MIRLAKDPNPSDAGLMRLYLAPRVVSVKLEEDRSDDKTYNNPIYDWTFGSLVYPYTDAGLDYPAGGTTTLGGYYHNRPLKISLLFSEAMKTDFPDFHVRLNLYDGTPLDFEPGETGGWSASHKQPDPDAQDAWTGYLKLPIGAIPGDARITLRAASEFKTPNGDSTPLELDSDGDGASDPNTPFQVSDLDIAPPPTVSMWSPANWDMYKGYQGVFTGDRLKQPADPFGYGFSFRVISNVPNGLKAISLRGPDGYFPFEVRDAYNQPRDAASLQGAMEVDALLTPAWTTLRTGDYVFEAEDMSFNVTRAPFRIVKLASAVLPAASTSGTFNKETFVFEDGSLVMAMATDVGIAGIDILNARTREYVMRPGELEPKYSFKDLADWSLPADPAQGFQAVLQAQFRDKDGNTGQETITLFQGNLGGAGWDGQPLMDPVQENQVSTDSPRFGLSARNALPDAVVLSGPWQDPATQLTSTYSAIFAGWTWAQEAVDCSAYDQPYLAQVSVAAKLDSGETNIYSGYVTKDGKLSPAVPPHNEIKVSSTVLLHAEISLMSAARTGCYPQESCTEWSCGGSQPPCRPGEEPRCNKGLPKLPLVYGQALPILGITHVGAGGPFLGMTAVSPSASPQTISLGMGVSVSNFKVNRAADLNVGVMAARAQPGWKNVLGGYALGITAWDNSFYTPPFELTIPFSGLTEGQASMIKVAKTDGSRTLVFRPAVSGGQMSFSLNSFSTFDIQAPMYDAPAVAASTGATLLSGTPGVSLVLQDPASPELRAALALMLSQGKTPVGPIFKAEPEVDFSSAAVLKLAYSTSAVAQAGVEEWSLAGYQFSALGSAQRLQGQSLDSDAGEVTAWTSGLHHYFGVFGATVPVALADSTPPRTELAFEGESSTGAVGDIRIATETLVSLTAADPASAPFPTSGLAASYYLIDRPFVDMGTTPPQTFTEPFQLQVGTHSLVYFSADQAGNLEAPHAVSVAVSSRAEQIPAPRMAAALDPAGRLWKVEPAQDGFALARYGVSGGLESSRALPNAPISGSWRIGFDPAGNAYAFTSFKSSAVLYGVSPQGSLFLSAAYPGFTGQVLALDSDGTSHWLAGRSSAGEAALWRADAAAISLVGLSPAATAQSVLADAASVWLAGNAAEAAFWRYDRASGQMARYDWVNSLGGSGSVARALARSPSGDIWVAGTAGTGSSNKAVLWRWDGGAVSLVGSSTVGFASQGRGLAVDAAGRPGVAGSVQGGPSSSTASLALWLYDASASPSFGRVGRYETFPSSPPINMGVNVVAKDGHLYILGTQSGGSSIVYSRSLGQGSVSGTLQYDAGFSGGRVFFVPANTPLFDDAQILQPLPAPASGSLFDYNLTGLLAPATYYFAVFYDTAGTMTLDSPFGAAPVALYQVPTFLVPGGSASLPQIVLNPDLQSPSVAILEPAGGSTITVLGRIQGTAQDNLAVQERVDLAVQDLATGLWWDSQSRRWAASEAPAYISVGGDSLRDGGNWSVGESFTPAGYLRTGGAYQVSARAVDLVGNVSTQPAAAVFFWAGPTGPVPPAPPADISGCAVGPSSIVWTWDLVEGATGYSLYAPNGAFIAAVATNAFTMTGLPQPDTPRRLCAAASNQYGEGPKSCIASPVYSLAAPVGPPRAVEVSSSVITWTWPRGGNSSSTFFELVLSTDDFMTSSWAAVSPADQLTSTRATTAGLWPNATYWAMVRAWNGNLIPTQFSPRGSTMTAQGIPGFSVAVDFDPATLNLKSNGQFVTATINVSGDRTAADISPASVLIAAVNDAPLASPIPPADKPAEDLRLKFDRQALIAVLPVGEQVKITLSGSFQDGTTFSGEGFIRTVMPGRAKAGSNATVFHRASGANVSLPSGALAQDTDITVLKVSAAPAAEEARRDEAAALNQLKPVGQPYDFGPEGTQFSLPVALTLPYDPEGLRNLAAQDLKIAYWNPAANHWEPLDSVVDAKARTVSAKTTHFSLYQVVGQQGSGGGMGIAGVGVLAADTEFRYVDAYAFPNPARGSQNVTIRTQVGLADSVDVSIYDISGRLMDSGSATAPQILDDGNGKGPQYTYDLVWDTSGVGSGIYIYAITAKKAGASPIHKRGKAGVIR
ncbi:MAG: T9SS type A sorting domain-containing protein [Elusimicrobia bacterium]|nr:T9SS type A sorting domain-containing protein [Elusimicrobiota bacterium]